MEIRVCPECEKAFFALVDNAVVKCTHCGHVVQERRGAERVAKELDCTFSYDGHVVHAKLQDYSSGGLRMVYTGEAVSADTLRDVNVEGLDVHRPAKTVWTMQTSDHSFSAGLRLL